MIDEKEIFPNISLHDASESTCLLDEMSDSKSWHTFENGCGREGRLSYMGEGHATGRTIERCAVLSHAGA